MVEREVVNGLMYILSTGCRWASLPKDLPARSTVNDYFCHWAYDGTLNLIHLTLYMLCREQVGREASPAAAVVTRSLEPDIDSQSVKSSENGASEPPGFDAGEKINGKKRHILLDRRGLLLHAIVHAADIQDPLGDSAAASLC